MNIHNATQTGRFGRTLLAGMLALSLGAFSAGASALSLTPADADATTNFNDNIDLNDNATARGWLGIPEDAVLTLYYKANVGGADEGSYKDVYDTVFANTPSDPADATISFTGSAGEEIPCPFCYLIVKDGKMVPAQYLFDLGDWDGQSISLTGFWPDKGAISNVAIWGYEDGGGGGGGNNPEPGILSLFAVGLLGMRYLSLRRQHA